MQITLEKAGEADYKRIKALYKSAFPPEERPPFFLLKSRDKSGAGQMLAVKADGAFAGFAYLICLQDMAYLFFFAISPEKRGAGVGTAVLKALEERYRGKRLFLAREQLDKTAGNYGQRVKRRDFYLRAGFSDLPCQIKEASVVYDMMGIGGAVSPAEYDRLITGWCGRLVRKMVDMRVIENQNSAAAE